MTGKATKLYADGYGNVMVRLVIDQNDGSSSTQNVLIPENVWENHPGWTNGLSENELITLTTNIVSQSSAPMDMSNHEQGMSLSVPNQPQGSVGDNGFGQAVADRLADDEAARVAGLDRAVNDKLASDAAGFTQAVNDKLASDAAGFTQAVNDKLASDAAGFTQAVNDKLASDAAWNTIVKESLDKLTNNYNSADANGKHDIYNNATPEQQQFLVQHVDPKAGSMLFDGGDPPIQPVLNDGGNQAWTDPKPGDAPGTFYAFNQPASTTSNTVPEVHEVLRAAPPAPAPTPVSQGSDASWDQIVQNVLTKLTNDYNSANAQDKLRIYNDATIEQKHFLQDYVMNQGGSVDTQTPQFIKDALTDLTLKYNAANADGKHDIYNTATPEQRQFLVQYVDPNAALEKFPTIVNNVDPNQPVYTGQPVSMGTGQMEWNQAGGASGLSQADTATNDAIAQAQAQAQQLSSASNGYFF